MPLSCRTAWRGWCVARPSSSARAASPLIPAGCSRCWTEPLPRCRQSTMTRPRCGSRPRRRQPPAPRRSRRRRNGGGRRNRVQRPGFGQQLRPHRPRLDRPRSRANRQLPARQRFGRCRNGGAGATETDAQHPFSSSCHGGRDTATFGLGQTAGNGASTSLHTGVDPGRGRRWGRADPGHRHHCRQLRDDALID